MLLRIKKYEGRPGGVDKNMLAPNEDIQRRREEIQRKQTLDKELEEVGLEAVQLCLVSITLAVILRLCGGTLFIGY